MADEIKSRAVLVHQHVTEHEVPEYDPTVSKPVVKVDERTGKVDTVSLDYHVDADSALAVQIPPGADATSQNVLGVLGEPSPEEVFGAGSKSSSKSSSK